MASLPTLKIKHPSGFAIINESDFDPKLHVLYDAPDEPKAKKGKKVKAEPEDPTTGDPIEPIEGPAAPEEPIDLPGDFSE